MPRYKAILVGIFVLALALRTGLALVNREANDDHMEAISMIADGHGIPDASQCAECFQPKFFYLLSAGLLNVLHVTDPDKRIVTLQLHNVVMAFVILLFVWKYLAHQPFEPRNRLLVFALVALNPCLVGINGQVTNDTLVILFGTLTIYFTDRFLATGGKGAGAWMIAFAIGAAVTKGSGLVICGAAGIALAVRFLFDPAKRKTWLRYGLYLAIAFLLVVPFAGGFISNYTKYGTPFLTGMGFSPYKGEPGGDGKPFRWRPGVTSTGGAYLTFRWGNMIDQPYIDRDPDHYVLHRTSLWSQLYGRALFTRFSQRPDSWYSIDTTVLLIGRIALVLGLVPLALTFLGVFRAAGQKIRQLFRLGDYFRTNLWVHMVFALAFVAFAVKYSHDYPDFSTMKFIFLLPALPALAHVVGNGLDAIAQKTAHRVLAWAIAALCIVHVVDVGMLVWQLSGGAS